MDMTAKGKVYPWQRLKALEDYINKHQDDFVERFIGKHPICNVSFMSDGVLVEYEDYFSDPMFTFIDKIDFMDWLHTDRKED